MKKLNNKGMTLVEIIVTFAILMVIVLEMVNLSVDVNNKSKMNEFKKELTEYSNNIRTTIQNDMIKYNAVSIEGKLNKNLVYSEGEQIANDKLIYTINFKPNNKKIDEFNTHTGKTDTNKCSVDADSNCFIDLIINVKSNTIVYNNELYKFNDSDYLLIKYVSNEKDEDDIVPFEIKITETLYEDDKTDYGFKIVHVKEEEPTS